MKNFLKVLIVILFFISYPFEANAAEILQINSSSRILVGDQNRNLTINLFCVDVSKNNELKAINLLKKEFPRGSKLKIKPFGFKDDILIAKVFNINGDKEMSELLITEGLTKEKCLD